MFLVTESQDQADSVFQMCSYKYGVCIFIEVNVYTCMNICICTVFLKNVLTQKHIDKKAHVFIYLNE
jgi:hypothetical protein